MDRFKLLLLCVPCFLIPLFGGQKVVRAAVDIGSGATKLKVAVVNLDTRKIEQVLVNESFCVQYQEDLENSTTGGFSPQVMEEGLKALEKSRDLALRAGAESVVAVATAAFRQADNAQEFIEVIHKQTGVVVHVVDQELEGTLGFAATAAQIDGDPEDIVVWDIGGGSYQFATVDGEGDLVVHRGTEASIPFKNQVIEQIKRQNHKGTPNPLSASEIELAQKCALKIAQKVDELFRKKIARPKTKVVGIGNIFFYRIYPLVEKKSDFTKEELSEKVSFLEGMSDRELGEGEYTNVAVTNPILVLGFMHSLGIEQMCVLDINNADGALIYDSFWS